MGIFNSKYNKSSQYTVVLQTGDMRAKYINDANFSEDARFPEKVIHRFLPSEIESKYEAMDFIKKFGLDTCEFFNIYNDKDNLVYLKKSCDIPEGYNVSEEKDLLLDSVNIIVACGSSSLQAFKLTPDGGKILLPVSHLNIEDSSILGNKVDPNLSVEALQNFGGSSTNEDVAISVLNYLKANAFNQNTNEPTNVIFVNQIGYSILGFNEKDKDPRVPNYTEKVVSIKYPIIEDGFTDNNGATGLINIISGLISGSITPSKPLNLIASSEENMFYIVARQCKVNTNGKLNELSGQWANNTLDMIRNEVYLNLNHLKNIGFVIDLGGKSGSLYSINHNGICNKVDGMTFMKDSPPNNQTSIDDFFTEFNSEYEKLFL